MSFVLGGGEGVAFWQELREFCGELEALGFPLDSFGAMVDNSLLRVARWQINGIEKISFSQQGCIVNQLLSRASGMVL